MKRSWFVTVLQIGIVPIALMLYGWYLGQLHESMIDLAGILMFITGLTGFILANVAHYIATRYKSDNEWYFNVLTGLLACGFVFMIIVIFARANG